MQDIDFDEIDRAVSSLANPETKDDIIEQRPGLVVAPRPSSGRFMDVVHPSSDMRPSRLSAPSASSLHREEVAERTEIAARPEPAAISSSAFHWPDPINLAEPTPASEPVAEPVTETPAPVLTEPEVLPDAFDEEATLPLESPFLSDTNVQKRPLGAFSGADAELPLLEDPIPFSGNSLSQSGTVTPAEEPTHEEHVDVPLELHEDLLSLDGHGKEVVEDEPLLEATNPQIAVTPVVPDSVAALSLETTAAGSTSIIQQYAEQPRTADQPSGAIFDTESYHQPLAHPAKKRSGVIVTIWIAALILIGGGIGAGLYFVVLPMLG